MCRFRRRILLYATLLTKKSINFDLVVSVALEILCNYYFQSCTIFHLNKDWSIFLLLSTSHCN